MDCLLRSHALIGWYPVQLRLVAPLHASLEGFEQKLRNSWDIPANKENSTEIEGGSPRICIKVLS